ncbi:MAG: 50S ribosomal protein L17 [Deltaproteobacteria bacterium]|nr:50S ribosomal protein L17 [Deltaproteobacteria bacterium]
MRHGKAGLKIGRSSSHRKAMFRNMVTSLFKYDRITTTDVKAKELKRWADDLITLAKRGDLHAQRQALAIITEKEVAYKLFNEAADRYGDIQGGYTIIAKIGNRPGDAAPISIVELVAREKSKPLQPRSRKVAKTASEAKKIAEKSKEASSEKPAPVAPETQTENA